jgi:hypothetical protein
MITKRKFLKLARGLEVQATNMKTPCLRAAALGAVVALLWVGGAGRASALNLDIQVGTPPPPPPAHYHHRYPPPFAGAVWIDGHQEWRHGAWVWVDGYYDHAPYPGAYWVPGHYHHGYWHPGHWA